MSRDPVMSEVPLFTVKQYVYIPYAKCTRLPLNPINRRRYFAGNSIPDEIILRDRRIITYNSDNTAASMQSRMYAVCQCDSLL